MFSIKAQVYKMRTMHMQKSVKSLGLNFLLGALLIFALAPFYILPLLIISLSGLLWQIHDATNFKMAVIRAYVFGLGYYFIGLSWLIFAFTFLPQSGQPFTGFMMGIPTVFALAAALSLFMATLGAISWFLPKKGLWGIAAQASLWVCISFLQGHLFTGFPWNPLAISLTFHPIFMQPAAFAGMYGLSFLAACIGYSYYAFKDAYSQSSLYSFFAFFILIFMAGAARYFYYDKLIQKAPSLAKLRAIQTGITVDKKWDEQLQEAHFSHVQNLMNTGDADYDAAILGETALPLLINIQEEERVMLGGFLPHNDSYLLIGANILKKADFSEFQNGFLALNKQGNIIHDYGKTHLVPFGEYVPSWLPFQKFIPMSGSFTQGKGAQTYQLPSFSYGPNICYEGIFQGQIVDYKNKPDILINAAIDSWYGNTHGPRQHAAQQKIRAVEEAIPMIRVTDNGISFAINAVGKTEKQLGINETGYFDYNLKKIPITNFSGKKSKKIPFMMFGFLLLSLYRERIFCKNRGKKTG